MLGRTVTFSVKSIKKRHQQLNFSQLRTMSITSSSPLVMIAKMFFHFPAIFRNLKIPSKQAKHGSNFYHSCGRQNVVVAMPGVNDLSQTCLKIMSTTMGKKKNHAISISQTRKGMLLGWARSHYCSNRYCRPARYSNT